MAERPPVVAPTFTPAGQLQLHYFSERTSFHCVHCQQDKTASLVATMGPDWAQAVCIICYGALVSAQPEKADTAAKAKPRPVQAKQDQSKPRPGQAKQPPSRKVKPKQPDETPPQPTAKKTRRQFKHQLPGADGLLEFFHAAGARAELVRGGYLYIDGSQTQRLAHLPPSETLEWNNIVNEIALKSLRHKFIRAVEDNFIRVEEDDGRFDKGLRVFLPSRERGFAVMRGDVRLAVIYATRAHIPHREA